MAPPAALLVFVSMFAAEPAGGIQAFHLEVAAGTLVPAAATAGCRNAFFLTVAPDQKAVYSLTAGRFGAAEPAEVVAWRNGRRSRPCRLASAGPPRRPTRQSRPTAACSWSPSLEGDSLAVFRIDAACRLIAVGEPVNVAKPSAIAIIP